MTCDTVRERLLEAGHAELDALRPHLVACPDCARMAAAIRQLETDLSTHVEEAVMAVPFTEHWDRATVEVRPRPRWLPGLHTGVIALAAAAVLAVGVWQLTPPPGPPPVPPPGAELGAALLPPEALEALDAFRAVPLDPPPEGLERDQEDAHLAGVLQAKAGAMMTAEAELAAVVGGDAPVEVRVQALRELGSLYAAMGDAIVEMPHPSYLTAAQSAAYTAALTGKARAQWSKAETTWRAALALATEAAMPDQSDALQAELDALWTTRTALGNPALAEALQQRAAALADDARARCAGQADQEGVAAMRDRLDQLAEMFVDPELVTVGDPGRLLDSAQDELDALCPR